MKIIVNETNSSDGYYESLEIIIDDVTKFYVHSDVDSQEDNVLSRNFSDCYDIPTLLKKAYDAGVKGEDFDIDFSIEER